MAGLAILVCETQRALLVTDAGIILSKWYNQSEQNLVAIFTSYAAQARNRENVPVLLPNECDILQACQLEQEGSFEYHPASVGNVGFRMNDKG